MNDTRVTRPRALRALALLLIVPSLVLAILAGCGGGGAPAGTATNESPAGASATPPAKDTAAAAPAATATPAELGAKVFATRCALCHGADGTGHVHLFTKSLRRASGPVRGPPSMLSG